MADVKSTKNELGASGSSLASGTNDTADAISEIITNIDGLEWKRDKWNWYAKWLLHFSEKQAVKYSDIIIGDNKGITDYIHSAYKTIVEKKRVELIAYGGDHVSKIEDNFLFEK